MRSSTGMKIFVGVLALISIVLAVELYQTKTAAQIPKEFTGVLTSEPPETQFPVRIQISAAEHVLMEKDTRKETHTVDPSVEYADLSLTLKGLGVQGQVLTGKLQRAK
jgi:hypothetical protein